MSNKNVKLQIVLSPYMYKKLCEWAACQGKPPSAFASYLIGEKIEDNIGNISTMFKEMIESGNQPDEIEE